MSIFVQSHTQLDVYRSAFDTAMGGFRLSKTLPAEERYSLTDQNRRSSRCNCANLAEAWRERRYPSAFVAKLSDSEAEAAETQTWVEFAVKCDCLTDETERDLYRRHESVIKTLVGMQNHADQWTFPK
jgi:four helix bundle protein